MKENFDRERVSFWRRPWSNPPLAWGCEIASDGVTLSRWNGSAQPAVAWRPLAAGSIDVSPLRENLVRPEEVRQALAGCLESLGQQPAAVRSSKPLEAALVIPDQAARVFFLDLESFPARPAEAVPLLRWKLKKSVPFDIEASTLSYSAHRGNEAWHILAVVSPQLIERQYEAVTEELGLKPRLVTLSTLAALGLLPEDAGVSQARSCLVAKYSPPWLTTAIVHEGTVCLFRSVMVNATGPGSIQSVLEAIHPAAAYFQDNFGRPLERAYLCGMAEWSGAVAASLSEELGVASQPLLQPAAAVAGWDAQQAEQHLAALMGVGREGRFA